MLRRRTKCARREHIPLFSEVVGVKRYQFFELDIFHAQVIDEIGKDTLTRTSQRIRTIGASTGRYAYSIRFNGVPAP